MIRRSLAARLLLPVALLASATLATFGGAWFVAEHKDRLQAEAAQATQTVILAERVNALVLEVVMESRGLYMSRDARQVEQFGGGLLRALERLRTDVAAWADLVPAAEQAAFAGLRRAVDEFMSFRTNLVEVARREGASGADRVGNNEANRANRQALNRELAAAADRARALAAERQAAAAAFGTTGKAVLGGLAALLVLVSAAAAWLMLRSGVLHPLSNIERRVVALGEGDLAAPVPETTREDELGRLARAAETLRATLARNAEVEARARADAEARARRGEALARAVASFEAEITAAMREMSGAADMVDGSARAIREAAATTREAGDAAASAAQSAAQEVSTVAAAAEELAASIAEISRRVTDSAAAARHAGEAARATDGTVRGLAESATRIGDVVRLIETIAGQTNLLALNATIEAARAGDAGKGFAVVASEVKTLAAQTAKATKDIAAQVAGIQRVTEDAVAAIRAIVSSISELETISASIAAGVEEQGAATAEIARASGGAASGAERVGGVVVRVGEAGRSADEKAKALLEAADGLKRRAAATRAAVDNFLGRVREAA
ncbi:MAG: methyl-accepting chemotaxis protein [Elioraea sp.]|nr:methyl-accepting chemotaxis protein [Elioraea sp.]